MKMVRFLKVVLPIFLLLTFYNDIFAHGEHEEKDHAHDEIGEKIQVSDKWKKEFGISVSVAQSGYVIKEIYLPGEVKIPVDLIAHVVTPVDGIIEKAPAKIGQIVRRGDVLAVIRSRELAELKSMYLVALEKFNIAKQNWERERKLWEKGISSQREYLDAKREFETTRIELEAVKQKLIAIGLSEKEIKNIPHEKELAIYVVRSPKNGMIVEKHAVEGEFKKMGDTLFKIIDTSVVWIDFALWQEYIPYAKVGQEVEIKVGDKVLSGKITWISPTLDQKTKTATARVVVKNDGTLKPATFVTGKLKLKIPAKVVVPSQAVVMIKDDFFVFVEKDGKFELRQVEVGIEGNGFVEIKRGLEVGERYVSSGAFFIKSEILKEEFSGGHAH